MNQQKEDIAYIKEALTGDQKAFHQLYLRYKQSLFMVCLRYAKDKSTAQDYLQESFITIFKNLNYYAPEKGAFESWAKRVSINTCLMDIRKKSLYSISISHAEQMESNVVNVLSEMSLQEMLALIKELPQGYKTIFNMYVIDGFSHKEIAEQLQISINTSKTQLRKARLILQKKILANNQLYQQNHG